MYSHQGVSKIMKVCFDFSSVVKIYRICRLNISVHIYQLLQLNGLSLWYVFNFSLKSLNSFWKCEKLNTFFEAHLSSKMLFWSNKSMDKMKILDNSSLEFNHFSRCIWIINVWMQYLKKYVHLHGIGLNSILILLNLS